MTMVVGAWLLEDRDIEAETPRSDDRSADWRPLVFASPAINLRPDPKRPAVKAATLIGGIVVLIAFGLVGTTFLGLAIAGPIALPVAQQQHIYVSASDTVIAKQLASTWWVFAIASVASFAAALATIVKLIQRLDPAA